MSGWGPRLRTWAFPAEPRREVGYQLYRVQRGLLPDDWKPMGTVGTGVVEMSSTHSRRRPRKPGARTLIWRGGVLRRWSNDAGSTEGNRFSLKTRRSSSNVFADLGFSTPEAEKLKIRAGLMIAIRQLITARRLTQAEAAKILGVTQPRISDLVRGKISLFSIDVLVEMLGRAGVQVSLRVRPAPRVA